MGRLFDPSVFAALGAVVLGGTSLALTFIDDLHG